MVLLPAAIVVRQNRGPTVPNASESRNLAPGAINLRLGAVRRLAYEAADCGLLSAGLVAGIRRFKGVKKLGVRLGNWLTAEQGKRSRRRQSASGSGVNLIERYLRSYSPADSVAMNSPS